MSRADAIEDVGRIGHDDPTRRRPGDDDAAADEDEPATDQGDAHDRRNSTGAGPLRQSDGEPTELVRRRPRRGGQPIEDRTGGAHDDEPAEQGDLGAELVGLGGDQQGAGHADEDAEHAHGRPARRAPSSGR